MNKIIVKKIIPPAVEGESRRNEILREGLDQVLKELKDKNLLTIEDESIDGYTVSTINCIIPESQSRELKPETKE